MTVNNDMALSNELVTCHLDISGDLSIYTLHKKKVNNNTAVLAKNRKIQTLKKNGLLIFFQ